MARCWLILVFCVSGLRCRPFPDNSNSFTTASLHSAAEQPGQVNDLADSDYPDMITEFLRLSTTSTVPSIPKSIKSSSVTTPSTRDIPSTTASPVTEKATQVVTAKFIPTVVTTTERSKTKDVTVKSEIEKPTVQQGQQQKMATTPSVPTTKLAAKETELNVFQPQTAVVKSKQTITTEATVTAQTPVVAATRQPQKVVSNSLQNVVQLPTVAPKQPVVQQPEDIKVQQQQLAATMAVPAQQTSLGSNNGPVRQQQQPGLVSQQTMPIQPIAQQQMLPSLPMAPQPVMLNPSAVQPQTSNPSVLPQQVMPMFQPQMIPSNLPVAPQQLSNQQFQQPIAMMANPAFRPQRPLFSAQAPLVHSKLMTPVTNRLVNNNQRRVFIQGNNGNPINLIPTSGMQQFMLPSFSPNGMQMLSPSVMSSSTIQQ